MRAKLDIKSPALTNRTTEHAISTATNVILDFRWARLEVAWVRSRLASLRRNARIEGIDPKTSALTKIRRVVVPSTEASREAPPGGRKPKGFEARNMRTIANAMARPNAPPHANNTRISVVSC